jgi:NitT/TauT family transport system substrate-binding protein
LIVGDRNPVASVNKVEVPDGLQGFPPAFPAAFAPSHGTGLRGSPADPDRGVPVAMKNPLKPAVWIGSVVVILGMVAAAWIYSSLTAPRQPAGPPERLTIAVNSTYIGSALVLIAAESGYFKAEGLDVTLLPHTTGRAALDAALAAQADLATVADTPFIFAVMKGQPASIVATISAAAKDHGLVARKDRGIATAADLKGKRVGVTLGTSGHFLLDVVLTGHMTQSRQVLIANLKPEEIVDGLLSGKVDAVATWNPYLDELQKALGENGLVFYSDGGFQVTFNVAARQDFIRQHPEAMKKLTRALLRAETFAAERPADARTIMARATKTDLAAVSAAWSGYQLQVKLDQGLLTLLEDQSRWAIKNGYVDKTEVPNYLDFIYPDALAAVKPAALTIIR